MSPVFTRTTLWLAAVLSAASLWASDTSVKNTGGSSTGDQKDAAPATVESISPAIANSSSAAKSSEKQAAKPSHKPPLVIEESTTHILKPLRPDGYPDYFAAINET